jgi:hypothetical protein
MRSSHINHVTLNPEASVLISKGEMQRTEDRKEDHMQMKVEIGVATPQMLLNLQWSYIRVNSS